MRAIVRNTDRIAVWFSCGAASAVALRLTVERYGRERVRAVNSPIAEEDPDNRRFLADVSAWAGVPIEIASNPAFPSGSAVDVWEQRQMVSILVPGKGSICPATQELKKEARYEWEREHKPDWHVLGFTAEEEHRHKRFVLTERENVLPVLIEGGWTKDDCFLAIQAAGIKLPRVYLEGFPNANCLGCGLATSPAYWNLLRRVRPAVFQARAEQSRRLGAKLVRHKGERIFLDELPETARGRAIPPMPECGLFCEELLPFQRKPAEAAP